MKITKVEKIEALSADLDMCRLEFDGGVDSAYIIYNYTNMLTYLEGEAFVTFRQDMYKGQICKFVNTLAQVGVVHTLDREENVRLYVDVTDNYSNISIRDIADGSTVNQAIVYVVSMRYDSSPRAVWADLVVQDRERRQANLRIFDPINKDMDFTGRYIMCNIRRNKYGLSTDEITTVDATFPYSPEVAVAERFISSTFANDPPVLKVLQESNFIPIAKKHVDMEPGYVLVRLAMELDVVNEMANLAREIDTNLLRRALLLEKFHILNSASIYHKEMVAFVMANRFKFPGSKEALTLLYSDEPSYSGQRVIFNQIKELAESVIKVKKGLV